MTRARISLALALAALGCAGDREPPPFRTAASAPLALEQIHPASDARLDPPNRLLGSFVGEGTRRATHLLSSDTALIAQLYRRFVDPSPPPPPSPESIWSRIDQAGLITLLPGNPATSPTVETALASFAQGHVRLNLVAASLRGNSCRARGASAEFIMREPEGASSTFRGPVLGSFQTMPRSPLAAGEAERRTQPPQPGPQLVAALLEHTERAMDQALEAGLSAGLTPFGERAEPGIEVNTLADLDAADVVPLWIDGEVHYAVALRLRRSTPTGDTLLAATVMLWDSAATTVQVILRPTALRLHGVRLEGLADYPPVYWRRLQAIAGFGPEPDYLWVEQVEPVASSVLWGVLSPVRNTVVAAARVANGCPP